MEWVVGRSPTAHPHADIHLGLAVGRGAAGGRHAATAGRVRSQLSQDGPVGPVGLRGGQVTGSLPHTQPRNPVRPTCLQCSLSLVAVADTSLCALSGGTMTGSQAAY